MTDEREQRELDARWEGLARFLAGESEPDEARRIREEFAGDAERAALVNALDAALTPPTETPLSSQEVEVALASVMSRRDPPAGQPQSADVVPLRPRPTVPPSRVPSRWRSPALRAAAAVVVMAGASMLWLGTRSERRDSTDGSAVVAASRSFRTALGQVDTLALGDGSTVILGPSSRLVLGDSFGGSSRETTLEGEAYFDVVHDDAHPFVVRTASATLRDVGTTFTVRSDSGRGTSVAVTSGAVDVTAIGARRGSPTVLRAGDRAEVLEDGMHVERGVVTESEGAWTRGALVFRDAPLSVVAVELRRWYGVELVVTDSTIAARRLTATFERSSADDLGRVLAAVLGGSVARSGDTLRLSGPSTR
jgi:transmembrane sensor